MNDWFGCDTFADWIVRFIQEAKLIQLHTQTIH